MPSSSLPGTATAPSTPVPPGVFATSMPPLSHHHHGCKASAFHNGATLRDTPSPSGAESDGSNKPDRSRGSQRASRNRQPPAGPLKFTIRRTSQSHAIDQENAASASPATASAMDYTCETQNMPPIRNHSPKSTACDDAPPPPASPTPLPPPPLPPHSMPSSSVSPPVGPTEAAARRSVAVCTNSAATITEPDLLGPCEPGSRIVLDGVVWLETPGMLVINVNWRGRSYLGSLMDATRNSLGPNCPDKSISALTLMRNRQWRAGPGSIYRNRPGLARMASGPRHGIPGLHYHHHHHFHLSGIGTSHSNATAASSAITTRSASAAAAQGAGGATEDDSDPARRPRHLAATTPAGAKAGRKTKRRNRRNGRVFSGDSAAPHKSPDDPLLPQVTGATAAANGHGGPLSPNSHQLAHLPFKCPQLGCEKRFPSQLSLRYHLQMGHHKSTPTSPRQKPVVSTVTSASRKKRRKLNGSGTTPRPQHALFSSPSPTPTHAAAPSAVPSATPLAPVPSLSANQEIKLETRYAEQPVKSVESEMNLNSPSSPQKPPRLAKARIGSAGETCPAVSSEEAKEEKAPSTSDALGQLNTIVAPEDDEQPPKLDEEERIPPAPSPAYSDISDDADETEGRQLPLSSMTPAELMSSRHWLGSSVVAAGYPATAAAAATGVAVSAAPLTPDAFHFGARFQNSPATLAEVSPPELRPNGVTGAAAPTSAPATFKQH